MKALVIAAALFGGEWDMLGPCNTSSDWSPITAGTASDWDLIGDGAQAAAEGPLKPLIVVFAPYWSADAGSALPAILELRGEYRIDVRLDDATFPAWVRDRASQDGKGYPLLWWTAHDGTGRVTAWGGSAHFCRQVSNTLAPAPAAARASGAYPIHRQRWNVNGDWAPSRDVLIAHLQTGQHAGRFPGEWLRSLSRAELLSLHDDDHEGRVQWAFVRGASQARAPVKAQAIAVPAVLRSRRSSASCPSGRCPR